MTKKSSSTINLAASRLREMALGRAEGALLAREEALVEALGVSRSTVRQAARLLEREGLLRVRRGIGGGYFASRPTLDTVAAAMSGYLDTLDMDVEDVTVVASVLWVEALRKAATLRTDAAREAARTLRDQVRALRDDAPFTAIMDLERESRAAIFALTKARYIELIFQINVVFARTRFPSVSVSQGEDVDREFREAWRKAKLMEMDAIIDGDPELGMLAARRSRVVWHGRVWPSDAHLRPSKLDRRDGPGPERSKGAPAEIGQRRDPGKAFALTDGCAPRRPPTTRAV